MIEWISANIGTIIICIILFLLFMLAIRHIIKTKKNGGCVGCNTKGCDGQCCHCKDAEKKEEK